MTEFISRIYGKDGYEIIIKTDSHEHYRSTEDFARRLIDHSKQMTNADRIRAMSDEELADVVANGVGCVLKAPHCMDVDCTPCILKWLQQSAEEDDHA